MPRRVLEIGPTGMLARLDAGNRPSRDAGSPGCWEPAQPNSKDPVCRDSLTRPNRVWSLAHPGVEEIGPAESGAWANRVRQ